MTTEIEVAIQRHRPMEARINPDDVFGPKIHPFPAGVFFKKDILPWQAFDEFSVAVDVWLKYMDDRHKRKALSLVKEKAA